MTMIRLIGNKRLLINKGVFMSQGMQIVNGFCFGLGLILAVAVMKVFGLGL